MSKSEKINDIKKYSKELRLAYTTRNIKELIDQAEIKDQGYVDFIHSILQKESDHRNEQGKINRIRLAEFPYKKYLEDLKIEHLPEDARRKLKQLQTLDKYTCFISLIIYRLLEKKLGEEYTCSEIIRGLKDMNFYEIKGDGYIPTYTRTDFTDALHEVFGFRTDYQIVNKKIWKNKNSTHFLTKSKTSASLI